MPYCPNPDNPLPPPGTRDHKLANALAQPYSKIRRGFLSAGDVAAHVNGLQERATGHVATLQGLQNRARQRPALRLNADDNARGLPLPFEGGGWAQQLNNLLRMVDTNFTEWGWLALCASCVLDDADRTDGAMEQMRDFVDLHYSDVSPEAFNTAWGRDAGCASTKYYTDAFRSYLLASLPLPRARGAAAGARPVLHPPLPSRATPPAAGQMGRSSAPPQSPLPSAAANRPRSTPSPHFKRNVRHHVGSPAQGGGGQRLRGAGGGGVHNPSLLSPPSSHSSQASTRASQMSSQGTWASPASTASSSHPSPDPPPPTHSPPPPPSQSPPPLPATHPPRGHEMRPTTLIPARLLLPACRVCVSLRAQKRRAAARGSSKMPCRGWAAWRQEGGWGVGALNARRTIKCEGGATAVLRGAWATWPQAEGGPEGVTHRGRAGGATATTMRRGAATRVPRGEGGGMWGTATIPKSPKTKCPSRCFPHPAHHFGICG